VANRRITQFPVIQPGDINDQDVLTLVHVFEVDPALRNKKFTFEQLRQYLDVYYVNTAEFDPLLAGNVVVSGYTIISGVSILGSSLNVSGDASFSQNVTITGDLTVFGDINLVGDLDVDDIDAVFITTDGLEVQVSGFINNLSGNIVNATSGTFQRLFAIEATGIESNFVSGNFNQLHADNLDVDTIEVSGITITGELVSSGTINANDVNVNGTLSGALITGNVINVNDLNVTSGNFDYISGITITGDQVQIASGAFTTMTGDDIRVSNISGTTITGEDVFIFNGEIVSGHFRTLTGETLTGETINVLDLNATDLFAESGYFNNAVASGIYVDTITGRVGQFENMFVSGDLTVTGDFIVDDIIADHITANSGDFGTGNFIFLSGQTISGEVGLFTQIDVVTLNASGLEFSGDQTISGDFTVIGNLDVSGDVTFASGLEVSGTISGTSGLFPDLDADRIRVSGLEVETIWVSGDATVSGNTSLEGELNVSGIVINSDGIITSGDLIVGPGGDFIVSGESIFAQSGVFKEDVFFDQDVTVTGDLNVSGALTVEGGISFSDDLTARNITATGNLDVHGNTTLSGDLLTSGDLTVSGTTVLRGDTDLLGALTVTGNISNQGDIETSGNILSRGDINAVNVYASAAITGETLNVTTLSGQNGIIENILFVSGYASSGLLVSGNAGVSGDLTVIGSGLFNGTVTGQTANFTFVNASNTLSGATVTGEQANFTEILASGIECSGISVRDQLNVPFGTVQEPGLGFDNPAVTGIYDGIMCEQVGGQYSTMTFVNQNASGMTISSGNGRFILTIWGG
jgi:filamentous hemagglutinin